MTNKICVPIYFCDENNRRFSENVDRLKPDKITMKERLDDTINQKTRIRSIVLELLLSQDSQKPGS